MASELFKKAEYYLFERMYEEAYVYFLEAALTERNAEAIDNWGACIWQVNMLNAIILKHLNISSLHMTFLTI